jgi:hypothetical protein
MFLIINCYKCGSFLIIKKGQKTKECPYCNQRLNLSKVRVVKMTSTSKEASHIVKTMKLRKENSVDENYLL